MVELKVFRGTRRFASVRLNGLNRAQRGNTMMSWPRRSQTRVPITRYVPAERTKKVSRSCCHLQLHK